MGIPSCGAEGQLIIYQVFPEGQCKLEFRKDDAHASAITSVKFFPSSDWFITLSRNKITTQWSMKKFSSQRSLLVSEAIVYGELICGE